MICRRSALLRRISGQGEMAVVELAAGRGRARRSRGTQRSAERGGGATARARRCSRASRPALAEVLAAPRGARRVLPPRQGRRRLPQPAGGSAARRAPRRARRPCGRGSAAVPMRSTVTGRSLDGSGAGRGVLDGQPAPAGPVRATRCRRSRARATGCSSSCARTRCSCPGDRGGAAAAAGPARERRWARCAAGRTSARALLEALGALWVHGQPAALGAAASRRARRVPLPTYAWQRERYWVAASADGAPARAPPAHAGGHPLLGEGHTLSTQQGTRLWETTLDLQRLPWLADHRVQGTAIFPARATSRWRSPRAAEALGQEPVQLAGVKLLRALVLPRRRRGGDPGGRPPRRSRGGCTSRSPGSGAGRPVAGPRARRGAERRSRRGAGAAGSGRAARSAAPRRAGRDRLRRPGRDGALRTAPRSRGSPSCGTARAEALGRVRVPAARRAPTRHTGFIRCCSTPACR